jgi:hypothetical protein
MFDEQGNYLQNAGMGDSSTEVSPPAAQHSILTAAQW